MLTEHEVMERLRAAVAQAGSQRKFAAAHGFTVGYINDVLRGKRALADRVLDVLGIERMIVHQVTYQEKKEVK